MPVYLRKNLVITPPSVSELPDNDDDFIQDPDQLRDELPQPFRFIDNCLAKLLDNAWEIIANREDVRVTEESKVRPPQYVCAVQMQLHGKASCLNDSQDGKYVIIGLPNGLAVVDALTQATVAIWEDEVMEISCMHTTMLSENAYLISTIDDMGLTRLFAFSNDRIYLLKSFNEPQEGSSKVIASKCEASRGGDYVGIFFESPSAKDSWIEIHKLPKDVWLKEIDSAGEKMKAAVSHQKLASPQPEEEAAVEYSHPSEGATAETQDTTEQHSQGSASPGAAGSPAPPGGEKSTYKFSPPNIVLKVRPPGLIAGVQSHSPMQMAKSVDSSGDVIGTGSSHLVTVPHLDQREGLFQEKHQELLKYLPKEQKQQPISLPTFHFLNPGRILPHGLEQSALAGQPTNLAIWWSTGTQVLFFSLVKPSKDLEHKADVVWPLASGIAASTVSPCTSLMGVALHDGTVAIWDTHLGMPRRMVHITEDAQITKLMFLDPSICPQEEGTTSPYPTYTAAYLLVCCSNGQMLIVNAGMGNEEDPSEVSPSTTDEDLLYTRIEPINSIPELLVTFKRNGQVFIQEVLTGSMLCEVTLPPDFYITSPWQPVAAVGGSGQMLFLKATKIPDPATLPEPKPEPEPVPAEEMGEGEQEVEDEKVENVIKLADTSIFVFQLRSFPTLDKYRQTMANSIPYMVHSTVSARIDALVKERISQQPMRKNRMQERWFGLKEELELLKRIRESSHKRAQLRSAFTESTIRHTPLEVQVAQRKVSMIMGM